MPNVYVTDETKANLEKVAHLEDRTMDGEINFLCKQRLELVTPSTPKSESDSTKN